ncbi:hypothetical protein BDQ17DRAFT_1466374 [Cyathus striatus]|nr:hypothetical protein BDQ17DRAFT_1466374 [Cyathus striatus]
MLSLELNSERRITTSSVGGFALDKLSRGQILVFGYEYAFIYIFEGITLGQNLMLTMLIVGRLLLYRYRIRKALGVSYGHEYISIASMLIESQAILVISQMWLMVAVNFNLDPTVFEGSFMITYQLIGQMQVRILIPHLYYF